MSTLLRNIIIIAFLAGLILFINESTSQPGRVVMEWYNYRLTTTMTFLVFIFNVSLILAFLVGRFVSYLLYLPLRWQAFISKWRDNRALSLYLKGLDAKLAGDNKQAAEMADKLMKALPDPDVSRPLAAQLAPTPERLHQLLAKPETSFAGHAGLLLEALERTDWAATKFHALAALKHRNSSPSVHKSLFQAYLNLGECDAALDQLPKLKRYNIYGNQTPVVEASVRLHAARNQATENPTAALRQAQLAQAACPDFVPAALFRAVTLASAGKRGPAERVLSEFWHTCPRLDVFEKWLDFVKDEPKQTPEKLQKRVWQLLESKFQHADDGAMAHLCAGTYALATSQIDMARKHLLQAFKCSANQTVLRKLAELEDKMGDTAAAQDWLEQALDAPQLHQRGDEVMSAYQQFRDSHGLNTQPQKSGAKATNHQLLTQR